MRPMSTVHWGMIGCGDVAEVKSGPALQKAEGSALVAVMRRDRGKAEDYARRHNGASVHDRAEDLIADPRWTPFTSRPLRRAISIRPQTAAAGKPCLVEKPMAITMPNAWRWSTRSARLGAPCGWPTTAARFRVSSKYASCCERTSLEH